MSSKPFTSVWEKTSEIRFPPPQGKFQKWFHLIHCINWAIDPIFNKVLSHAKSRMILYTLISACIWLVQIFKLYQTKWWHVAPIFLLSLFFVCQLTNKQNPDFLFFFSLAASDVSIRSIIKHTWSLYNNTELFYVSKSNWGNSLELFKERENSSSKKHH